MDKDIERLGKERLGRQKKHKKWILLTIMLSVIALSASVYNLIQPAHAITASDGTELADFSAKVTESINRTSYDASTNTTYATILAQYAMTVADLEANLNYYYEIPANTVIDTAYLNTTAYLTVDDNGVDAFDYHYIEQTDESGNVHYYLVINFRESYKTYCEGKNTDQITGHYELSVAFGSDNKPNKEGNYTVTIGGSTLSFSPDDVTYDENKNIKRDISVTKTATNNGGLVYNGNDTYVEFTVKVTTENGTDGSVNVSDVLTSNDLSIDNVTIVSVKKGQGWQTPEDVTGYVVNPGATDTGYSWNFTLDSLNASEYYEIIYRYPVTVTDSDAEIMTGKNSVTVSAGEGKYSVEASDSKDISISKTSKNLVEKTGEARGEYIYWTIKVNTSKANISGYTLTDEAFDSLVATDIGITCNTSGGNQYASITSDSSTGKVTGIKFEGINDSGVNANTYTITYKQKIADLKVADGGTVSNIAKISNGAESQEAKADATVNVATLNKTANSGTVGDADTDGNRYLTINWTTTYNANGTVIKAGTTYTDELETGSQSHEYQWFTYAQIGSIYGALNTHFDGDNIEFYVYELNADNSKSTDRILYTSLTDNNSDMHFYKYEVQFVNDISAEKSGFTVTYNSTANISDYISDNLYGGSWYFKNTANIGTKTVSPTYKYEKTVIKSDSTDDRTDTTSTASGNHEKKVGDEISWTIRIALDEVLKDTDYLDFEDNNIPANLELVKVEYGSAVSKDKLTVAYSANQTSTTANTNSDFEVTYGSYGNSAISARFTRLSTSQAEYLYVKITCKLGEGFFGNDDSVTVNNTAKITNGINKTFTSNQQTQTITKYVEKETPVQKVNNVKKNIYYRSNEAGKGLLHYAITINPENATLNGGNALKLVDELTYYEVTSWPKDGTTISLDLKLDSVALYQSDGTGTFKVDETGEVKGGSPVKNTDWSYTYDGDGTSANDSTGHTKVKRIDVTVPDKKEYILIYTYQMNSTSKNVKLSISNGINNSVTLIGETTDYASANDQNDWTLSTSSMSISSDSSFTFWKVETGHYNVLLPGAVFTLYKYNDQTGGYDKTDIQYTTDSGGAFKVKQTNESITYDYNTAYYLQETTPPDGYAISDTAKPYYFYFSDPTGTTDERHMPDDFEDTATDFTTNYSGTGIENTPALTIKKVWKTTDNQEMTEVDENLLVKVELYQICGKSDPVAYETDEPIILSKDNEWTYTLKGLPTVTDDNKKITYKVTEVNVTKDSADVTDEYIVSYSDNNGEISVGTITITNTQNTQYELPETGGTGRNLLYMFGGMLALGAGFLLIYKKHKII